MQGSRGIPERLLQDAAFCPTERPVTEEEEDEEEKDDDEKIACEKRLL